VPVDRDVAAEWARLLGEHDRNRDDTALAATARVRGLVVVTRNVRHFRGRSVRVLDPFKAPITIETVCPGLRSQHSCDDADLRKSVTGRSDPV